VISIRTLIYFVKRALVTSAICGFTGAVMAAPVDKLDAQSSGRIEFTSNSYLSPSRWNYIREVPDSKPVVVHGDLLMPKNIAAGTRVPAVVLSHGSGGVHSSAYDVWGKELTAAGYAVFVIDSFTPRGATNTMGDQTQVPYTSSLADARNGLKLLATHPLIDAKRIFNMGFSRGGTTAFETAWPSWQRPVDAGGAKFAGHIAMYQGNCNARYRTDDRETATAPILMLLADRKLETGQGVEQCIKYAEDLAKKGNVVIYKEYTGAYHGFDGMYAWSVNPRALSGIGCDFDVFITPEKGSGLGKGFDFIANKPMTNFKELGDAVANGCGKHRTHITYGTKEFRDLSVKDSLEFMNGIK
jgi:dienelactone hydrolase